jgi:hypothetical protein
MNDIRGGRVTCPNGRHSAVAEFRGGQVPGSTKGRAERSSRAATRTSLERRVQQPCHQFQSNFGPTQERDKWRVPL